MYGVNTDVIFDGFDKGSLYIIIPIESLQSTKRIGWCATIRLHFLAMASSTTASVQSSVVNIPCMGVLIAPVISPELSYDSW